jgi:NTE family protein
VAQHLRAVRRIGTAGRRDSAAHRTPRPCPPGACSGVVGWLLLGIFSAALGIPEPGQAAEPAAKRPRIGLALSGGGARGFAHIGVIKVLQEWRIPVDVIAGTSMGSVVGGLRALGYSPDELAGIAKNVNWQEIFRDETPREALFYGQKQAESKFFIQLGVRGLKLELPSGLSAGQKIFNLFSLLTLPAAGIQDFDHLPIPYRAVATDLVSGQEVVLDGRRLSLAEAMRASMSVPGAFTPVDSGDMLLVDGGLVKNLPVDVVQGMGADLVIAVNVSAPLRTKGELDSVLAVMDQTISLQMVRSTQQQIQLAQGHGIVLTPDLHDLSSTDFPQAQEIMRRGEQVARASSELRALAARMARYPRAPLPNIAVPSGAAAPGTITIERVVLEGPIRAKERQRLKQLDVSAGQTLTPEEIEDKLTEVFGSDYYQNVDFRIEPGTAQGKVLLIRAREGAPQTIGIGAQYSDKYGGIGLVDLSLNRLGGAGGSLSSQIQFGGLLDLQSAYTRYGLIGEQAFVRPRVFYRSAFQYSYSDDSRSGRYNNRAAGAEVSLGNTFRTWGEVELGYRWKHASFDLDFGEPTLPEARENVAAIYISSHIDTLDRLPFPRAGTRADLSYERAQQELGGEVSFDRLDFRYQHFWSIGERQTLRLAAELGSSLDSSLLVYEAFRLGGTDFAGYDWDELRGNHVANLSLSLRQRLGSLPLALGRDIYLTVGANAGNTWDALPDLDQGTVLRYGGSVGLALETVVGPVSLDFAHGSQGRSFVYFSAGYPF